MTAFVSPFRIDLLGASGNRLGGGPLTTVTQLATTERLDAAGDLVFSLPAADPRTVHITAGAQFDVYDTVDGYLGRFLHKQRSLDEAGGLATLTVQAFDLLRELSRYTIGYRRTYNYEDVADVVDDLIDVAPGWTAEVDASIGNTTVAYEGGSVLMAVDVLRDRWGQHYRLKSTDPDAKVLQFGAFGSASGVRLTQLRGQVSEDFAEATEIAIVERIRLVEESEQIFNSVIPLGAGQGVNQITIQGSIVGDYAVQTGTNKDGSSYYYLQDTDSIATYGVRWKELTLSGIHPLTNSDLNLSRARDALKLAAEAYLNRHLVPTVVYAVTVRALRSPVRVGDTVRLAYRGVVDNYGYLDVDEDFYVMDLARNRVATGERTTTLTIATTAERRTADSDVLVEVVRDVRALKVDVPVSMAYGKVGPYVKRMSSAVDAPFTIRIGDEVTFLHYAMLRFATAPLRSSVTSVASGGGTVETSESAGSGTISSGGSEHYHSIAGAPGSTPSSTKTEWRPVRVDSYGTTYNVKFEVDNNMPGTALFSANDSPAHTHQVTVPDHTHDVNLPDHTHDAVYGLFEDTVRPSTISIAIDGIDRTAALGGPWAAGGGAVTVEVDIADYLTGAAGGLRQDHSVEFSCTGGRGELEFEVDMLVSVQPIQI